MVLCVCVCVCVCEPLVFNRPPRELFFLLGFWRDVIFADFFSFEREAPKLFFRVVLFPATNYTISNKQKERQEVYHIKHIKHIKHE